MYKIPASATTSLPTLSSSASRLSKISHSSSVSRCLQSSHLCSSTALSFEILSLSYVDSLARCIRIFSITDCALKKYVPPEPCRSLPKARSKKSVENHPSMT